MTTPDTQSTPRLVRDEPARTQPHRQPARMFLPSTPSSVHRGVENAYRVIDEYLAHGKEVAQRRRPLAAVPSQQAAADETAQSAWSRSELAQALLQGAELPAVLLQAWTQLAAGVSDVLNLPSAAQGLRRAGEGIGQAMPAFLALVENMGQSSSATRAPDEEMRVGAMPVRSQRIVVQTSSQQPLTVDVKVETVAPEAQLRVSAFYLDSGDAPPIRGATLEIQDNGDCLRFGLQVAPEQAAGTYGAMVFDASDDRPCGTVRLVVGS